MPNLLFRSGVYAGRRVPVRPEGLVLGRDPGPSCDVALGSSCVSGRHAAVVCEGGRWIVRDLDSRNGTFLNDQPVQRAGLLSHGARIVFGDVEATFEDLSSVPEPPVEPPVEPPRVLKPVVAVREPPPDLIRTLRMGSGLLRRSGAAGAGLVQRVRDATAEIERAVALRDPEATRRALTVLLEDGGALHGLADDLKGVFETSERSLDHFDKLLREADQQGDKAAR